MYISATHTKRQSIKNTIFVVVNRLVGIGLKAHTHMPILTRSAVKSALKSADFTTESANFNTNSIIVDRRPLLNTFNILEPTGISRRESADSSHRLMANWPHGYGP